MTQNLDLAIGNTNTPLTSDNTDINVSTSDSGIYSNGYTQNNGVWTWIPASTALTSGKNVDYDNKTISNWNHSHATPSSAEGGNTYIYTSGDDNPDTRYDSLSACATANHTESDCKHYHVGNYYNWTAAVASNDTTNVSKNTRVSNSICPKGWRLPNNSTTDNIYNEFGRLFYNVYNITSSLSNGTGNVGYKTGGFIAIRTSSLYFVRSGRIDNSTLVTPNGGNYWSNTVYNNNRYALNLSFDKSGIYVASNLGQNLGMSVRCLAR